jgi:hypothetical protein
VLKIRDGETVIKNVDSRFYRDFKNLSLSIKGIEIEVKRNNHKELHNNKYTHPYIYKPYMTAEEQRQSNLFDIVKYI